MEPFSSRHAPASLRLGAERKTARGFTLVELLVVLGIMVLIMSVVLLSQGNFNRSIILANTAYDLALTIRSAESYGISSRVSATSANTGYGVHFDSANSNSFVFFADTYPAAACSTPGCTPPGDHIYTAGQDALVQTYRLGNNITIQKFCVYASGWTCSNTGAVTSVDIAFARPNPVAFISKNGMYAVGNTTVCLVLASQEGTTRSIAIWNTGAINANSPCNP